MTTDPSQRPKGNDDNDNGGSRRNGPDRLELRLGTRAVGLSARDLVPILFIALIGVFLYIGMQNNRESMSRVQQELQTFQTSQQQAVMDFKAQLQAVRDLGSTQRQVSLDTLKDLFHELHTQVDEQTEKLRKLLIAHDFNADRPLGERLPLELTPPEKRP